jgi:hypothetical protein
MDASTWFTKALGRIANKEVPAFFKLVDEGYFVWLGKNSETTWSKNNDRYPFADTPSNAAWAEQNKAKYDIGWVEYGDSDLPAMIDKVRSVTLANKVNYFGYS